MIDGYTIMTSLRDVLRADETLNALLGTIPESPKVLLGASPAGGTQCPVIMIPDSAWIPGRAQLRSGDFSQDINVWTKMLTTGFEDFATLYGLCRRISTLLDSQRIETADTVLASLRLIELRPATLLPEDSRCFKTMTFTGHASQK